MMAKATLFEECCHTGGSPAISSQRTGQTDRMVSVKMTSYERSYMKQ
jgi:hypothetical protein